LGVGIPVRLEVGLALGFRFGPVALGVGLVRLAGSHPGTVRDRGLSNLRYSKSQVARGWS
jgi:hypothetical protein